RCRGELALQRGTCLRRRLRPRPINKGDTLMMWLASFPRSGNTFFRIILHEVYGIETAEYALHSRPYLQHDYTNYSVVKTHLLPDALVPNDPTIPAVYLIRDGRDAVVSLAHYRSNIGDPGSSFRKNLRAAIRAPGGSF